MLVKPKSFTVEVTVNVYTVPWRLTSAVDTVTILPSELKLIQIGRRAGLIDRVSMNVHPKPWVQNGIYHS